MAEICVTPASETSGFVPENSGQIANMSENCAAAKPYA